MAKKYKKKELGQGIRALLSNIDHGSSNEGPQEDVVRTLSNTIATIPLNSIEVNPGQPRIEFDEEALQELSESIKVHGLIQPITVRRLNEQTYQLISGERRMRASKIAGLKEVPAYIRLANDQEMLEMALIENIQREDLNAIEVANSYQRLIEECELTHEALSERVGKNRSSVTNYLRLLKLPPDVQSAIKEQKISMGHARALAGVEDVVAQIDLLDQVLDNELSVRSLEELIRRGKKVSTSKPSPTSKTLPHAYEDVRRNLSDYLETKVEMKRNSSGKGKIIINFSSDADLNRLLDLIEES